MMGSVLLFWILGRKTTISTWRRSYGSWSPRGLSGRRSWSPAAAGPWWWRTPGWASSPRQTTATARRRRTPTAPSSTETMTKRTTTTMSLWVRLRTASSHRLQDPSVENYTSLCSNVFAGGLASRVKRKDTLDRRLEKQEREAADSSDGKTWSNREQWEALRSKIGVTLTR